MNAEWQWILVVVIVTACVMDVGRRVWKAVRQLEKGNSGCRRCSSCGPASPPSVVSIVANSNPRMADDPDAQGDSH